MFLIVVTICLLLSPVMRAHNKPGNDNVAKSMVQNPNYTNPIETALRKQLHAAFEYCQSGSESVNIAREALIIVPGAPDQDIMAENVTFLLFTKTNPVFPYILQLGNKKQILESTFDPQKEVVIFVDGYFTTVDRAKKALPQGILSVEDVNLIIVNRDSYNFFNGFYSGNRTIPKVGKILGNFIQELISVGSDPKKFYLIGFSAGGEIISMAAKLIEPKIARMLAIDPQGNCFSKLPPTQRLARTDADFVAVIFGSTGVFALPPLPIYGHVTFYLNDAVYQPECVTGSPPINSNTLFAINACSHNICADVFFQSLINPNKYVGVRCNSTEEFKRHECNYSDTLAFGYHIPQTLVLSNNDIVYYFPISKHLQNLYK